MPLGDFGLAPSLAISHAGMSESILATSRLLVVFAMLGACGRSDPEVAPRSSVQAPEVAQLLLHVVDGPTGRELDEVEFTLGIGSLPADPVVPCELGPVVDDFPLLYWSSPIRVPRCLQQFGGVQRELALQTFAVRAAGRAWNRIRVDTTSPGRRTVELWPAMLLVRLDSQTHPDVEWTATSLDVSGRTRPLEARGGVICEHLEPGRWRIEASECIWNAATSISVTRDVELKVGEALVLEDDFGAELFGRGWNQFRGSRLLGGWSDAWRCASDNVEKDDTYSLRPIEVEATCGGMRVPSDDFAVRWWCASHVGASESMAVSARDVGAFRESEPRPFDIGVLHVGTWWVSLVPPPDFEVPAPRCVEVKAGSTPRITFELKPRRFASDRSTKPPR